MTVHELYLKLTEFPENEEIILVNTQDCITPTHVERNNAGAVLIW